MSYFTDAADTSALINKVFVKNDVGMHEFTQNVAYLKENMSLIYHY